MSRHLRGLAKAAGSVIVLAPLEFLAIMSELPDLLDQALNMRAEIITSIGRWREEQPRDAPWDGEKVNFYCNLQDLRRHMDCFVGGLLAVAKRGVKEEKCAP